ncbi:hypothetical protein HID58_094895, partial [Brassica napus]
LCSSRALLASIRKSYIKLSNETAYTEITDPVNPLPMELFRHKLNDATHDKERVMETIRIQWSVKTSCVNTSSLKKLHL